MMCSLTLNSAAAMLCLGPWQTVLGLEVASSATDTKRRVQVACKNMCVLGKLVITQDDWGVVGSASVTDAWRS